MRKIFLLLLLPALGIGNVNAATGNGNPKGIATSPIVSDTAILVHKVKLPKDTTVRASATSIAVKKAAQSLPSSIRSAKVYEQINNNIVAGYVSNYATRYGQHLQLMVSRGEPYFVMIEKIFREHGIPEEMKYLAVIESSFNTNARSRVGAVGTWQFMSGTARIFGLSVGRKVDERKDFYKSTIAAAKYLNELYDRFGDWLLVVAAYNCGPGGVMKAMKVSGREDFWGMQYFLPTESRNHVYKFVATGYILDRFNNFFGVGAAESPAIVMNTETPRAALTEDEIYSTVEFNISGKYKLEAIAKKLDMELAALDHLNPGFAKMMSGPENSYDLRIPQEKMKLFMAQKEEILKESLQISLDDKAVAMDKSKFPPPAKRPVVNENTKKSNTAARSSHKSKKAKHTTATRKKRSTTAKRK